MGKYATNGDVLVFIPDDEDKRYKVDYNFKRELLAVKFNNVILGNSSKLKTIKTEMNVTEVQRILSEKVVMVPFTVFEQAKLNLSKFELIEKGKEETIHQKRIITKYNDKKKIWEEIEEIKPQHFTGACLFKIQDKVFLFDVDRNELEHGIINPFLVNLTDKTVKTISEAYESLKPKEVKDAEKRKTKVKRQGEWFFIPVTLTDAFIEKNYKTEERKVLASHKIEKVYPQLVLRAGQNRPNIAQLGFEHDGKIYVKNVIRHQGREHKEIVLKTWHQAIPNTATESWTVTGDID